MNTRTFVMTSILAALALSPWQTRARTFTLADEAKITIENLRDSANSLRNASDELRTFATNPEIDAAAHSEQLMAAREEINNMGREMRTLDAEHDALPEWEQQAVAKTLPLLKDAAANTEGAIEYLENHGHQLWSDRYHGFVERIAESSGKMETILRDSLKLAKIRDHERSLNNSLNAAGGE